MDFLDLLPEIGYFLFGLVFSILALKRKRQQVKDGQDNFKLSLKNIANDPLSIVFFNKPVFLVLSAVLLMLGLLLINLFRI